MDLFSALKSLKVEEDTSDRLCVQIYDVTMGFVFMIFVFVGLLATLFNIQKGEIVGAILCVLIACLCFAGILYFLGVKRIIVDRETKTLSLTFRSLLRQWQKSVPLEEVERLVLVDVTANRRELALGETLGLKRSYLVEAVLDDRAPLTLHSGNRGACYELGQKVMTWWQNHSGESAQGDPE